MLKPYEEYKEINLPWLKEIPKHWSVYRNKNLIYELNDKSTTGSETLLTLSQYNGISIKSKNNETKTGMKMADSLIGYNLVSKDDIVMNIMLAWNGSTAASNYDGIISPAYAVFRVKNNVNPWYLHYLFRLPDMTLYFKGFSTGVVNSRLRLYPEILFQLYSILPPLEEQNQIVRYLDYKISKINKLINIKKKEAELFKELKQALITKAVTKGIDENVKMKDSGVEWIGEIPEDWSVSRLKYITTRIGDGLHGTPVYDDNGDYFFINGNNLGNKKLEIKDNTNRIDLEEYNKYKIELTDSTLLISLNGTVGNLSYYNSEPVILSKSVGYISLINGNDIDYLYFYLQNDLIKKLFTLSFEGTTINNLSLETLRSTIVLLPKLSEQKVIADYLDKKCEAIDKLVSEKEQVIYKLEEYKKSLIYECVTGKKEIINSE